MDNVDEFFQKSYYNIIRVLLGISGLWPYHTLRRRCAIYIGIVLVCGSGFIFQVLGTIDVLNDSFELIDCMPVLSFATVTYIKLISAVYMLPRIKILLIKMKGHCLSPKSEQETKIELSHALNGRNLGYTYTGLLAGHSVSYLSMTFLTKFFHNGSTMNETSSKVQGAQAGLPYRANYLVDINTYYIPIFIHTATCEVSLMTLIITFDVLYLTLLEHCCGLYAALRYRLENAFELEDGSHNLVSTFKKDKSYSNIVYSIRRHAEATQFASIVESVYSFPLFVHVGSAILTLSVLGFQIVTNTENVHRLMTHVSYLNGLLLNLLFENWQGQKIIDSSEKVYESAYNAKWYNMPTATKKLLLIIMLRSKKPTEITAGKLIIMSYVTFSAVIRAASSYFMLLRSFQ